MWQPTDHFGQLVVIVACISQSDGGQELEACPADQ
jgi:hypothetical protein